MFIVMTQVPVMQISVSLKLTQCLFWGRTSNCATTDEVCA